jgi:hypothetical protein
LVPRPGAGIIILSSMPLSHLSRRDDPFPSRFMIRPTLFLLCAALVGCGGKNASLTAPSYDPAGMAQAAISQYDKNGNGSIDGAELDAIPALKSSLAAIDTNKDKAISLAELTTRFESYQAANVGALGVSVMVRVNGTRMGGVTVTFVPEDCMKGTAKGGSGTTGDDGAAEIQSDGVPGLPLGLYKITLSKKGASGNEELPARFNSQTTLGREIVADPRGGTPTIDLDVTSK